MMRPIGIFLILNLGLLGGCATKKYVAQTVDPVNAKLNQVDQNNQKTQKQLDEAEPRISDGLYFVEQPRLIEVSMLFSDFSVPE